MEAQVLVRVSTDSIYYKVTCGIGYHVVHWLVGPLEHSRVKYNKLTFLYMLNATFLKTTLVAQ